MQLSGETEIAAPRQRVWDVLTDPHQVTGCVPGDLKIEVIDERNLRVTAQVGNGFFQTTVTVEIELTDLDAPERATATATGSVMASPVIATGSLELEELGPNVTRTAWTADVTLGGMLVGFAGMVQAPAQGGVDRTIECLKAKLEAEADAGAAVAS